MATSVPCRYTPNMRRACLKVTAIVAVTALFIVAATIAVDDSAVDQLKFELSLPMLILLVVVANLVSSACLCGLYVAYRWVRRDLKPPRAEDVSDDESAL